MKTADALLEALSRRFAGVDVQHRRSQPEWPAPWRATLVTSKNERADYRITTYGDSLGEALDRLCQRVAELDKEGVCR